MSEPAFLRRYTDLPALVYLLHNRVVTLLDPTFWDDANDSRFMLIYKDRKQLATVLALCFAESPETYHHWRVFAHGASGACITFRKEEILAQVERVKGVTCRTVQYKKIENIRETPPKLDSLPFLKRAPYEPEREYRVIYEHKQDRRCFLDISIPLSAIERITLSPWINERVASSVKQTIKSIRGCSGISVTRTTLINNEQWQRYGEAATLES